LYQIGFYPINMLSSLINQLISPIFFHRSGDAPNLGRLNNTRRLNHYLLLGTLVLTALASIAAVFFHNSIFALLVAKEYRGVSLLLPFMLLSGGLVASVQWASMFLMNSMETGRLLLPRLIGSFFGVGLNFLGAYLFGLPGVVFATLIFLSLYLVWLLQLSRWGSRWGKVVVA
jgi:O-antigen/teichoic acid export membrane protein